MLCAMLFLQGTSDLEQHIDYSVGPAGPAEYLTVKVKEGSLELVIEVCMFIRAIAKLVSCPDPVPPTGAVCPGPPNPFGGPAQTPPSHEEKESVEPSGILTLACTFKTSVT